MTIPLLLAFVSVATASRLRSEVRADREYRNMVTERLALVARGDL